MNRNLHEEGTRVGEVRGFVRCLFHHDPGFLVQGSRLHLPAPHEWHGGFLVDVGGTSERVTHVSALAHRFQEAAICGQSRLGLTGVFPPGNSPAFYLGSH